MNNCCLPTCNKNNSQTNKCQFCDFSYCSSICKIKHWKIHKDECEGYKENYIDKLNNKSNKNIELLKLPFKETLDNYQIVLNSNKDKQILLGKGSFGEVKLIKELSTNKLFAIKIINKKLLNSSINTKNLSREINYQKKINHINILKLYKNFEDEDNIYLILEYAEKGSLFNLLKQEKYFSEESAFYYFFQTCLAINYLHKINIIHRDIKPENILLTKKDHVKISDFGFAIETKIQRTTICGTLDYMAPELIDQKPYSYKIDIYSLGILLYELLFGITPYHVKDMKTLKQKMIKFSIDFPQNKIVSKEAKELIILMTQYDPMNRIEIKHILEHEWMKIFYKKLDINLEDWIQEEQIVSKDGTPILETSYIIKNDDDIFKKKVNEIENELEKKKKSDEKIKIEIKIAKSIEEEDNSIQIKKNLNKQISQLDENYLFTPSPDDKFIKKPSQSDLSPNKLDNLTNEVDEIFKLKTKPKYNFEIKPDIIPMTMNNSYKYTEARDHAYQEFQTKFIDITEGKNIDNKNEIKFFNNIEHKESIIINEKSYDSIKENKISHTYEEEKDHIARQLEEIENELKLNENKLNQIKINDKSYNENKIKTKIDKKKEKIFKILEKIEKNKINKTNYSKKKLIDGEIIERDCLYSKACSRRYNELSLKEKLLFSFGCLIIIKK